MKVHSSDQIDCVKLVLIEGIASKIRKKYDSQREAATDLDCHEGVVSRLVNGSHERFSIAFLIDLATKLGAKISVTVN